jgi:DNA polymerase/3'-5' exonuclease PolX
MCQEVFEKEGILDLENGTYKARAFRRAFQAIDACPNPINSGNDAIGVGYHPHVGLSDVLLLCARLSGSVKV